MNNTCHNACEKIIKKILSNIYTKKRKKESHYKNFKEISRIKSVKRIYRTIGLQSSPCIFLFQFFFIYIYIYVSILTNDIFQIEENRAIEKTKKTSSKKKTKKKTRKKSWPAPDSLANILHYSPVAFIPPPLPPHPPLQHYPELHCMKITEYRHPFRKKKKKYKFKKIHIKKSSELKNHSIRCKIHISSLLNMSRHYH